MYNVRILTGSFRGQMPSCCLVHEDPLKIGSGPNCGGEGGPLKVGSGPNCSRAEDPMKIGPATVQEGPGFMETVDEIVNEGETLLSHLIYEGCLFMMRRFVSETNIFTFDNNNRNVAYSLTWEC